MNKFLENVGDFVVDVSGRFISLLIMLALGIGLLLLCSFLGFCCVLAPGLLKKMSTKLEKVADKIDEDE